MEFYQHAKNQSEMICMTPWEVPRRLISIWHVLGYAYASLCHSLAGLPLACRPPIKISQWNIHALRQYAMTRDSKFDLISDAL